MKNVVLLAAIGGIIAIGPAEAETYRPGPAILTHIREAATRHRISERLVYAVVDSESGFNPNAVSSRGALGLMQLMPSTASMLGVRNAFDPRENIDAGVRHLRALMDRFDRSLPLVLAAYNAGEQAVIKHRGVPPYPETRQYVTRVLRLVQDHSHPELSAPAVTPVRYRTSGALAGLAVGIPKARVFEALASEWIKQDGRIVKLQGMRIRAAGRAPWDTFVELGEVPLTEPDGTPTRYWLVFEDQRLVARGRPEEWSTFAARYEAALTAIVGTASRQ